MYPSRAGEGSNSPSREKYGKLAHSGHSYDIAGDSLEAEVTASPRSQVLPRTFRQSKLFIEETVLSGICSKQNGKKGVGAKMTTRFTYFLCLLLQTLKMSIGGK